MKKNFYRWLAGAMCAAASLTGMNASAQFETITDKLFIDDFSIAPGESKVVEVNLENHVWAWDYLITAFTLPEGLSLEPLTEADFAPEEYTTEITEKWNDGCYAALSTAFGNAEYLAYGEQGLEQAKRLGQTYPVFDLTCEMTPNGQYANIVIPSCSPYLFNCTHPVVLLKLKADERLSDDSTIEFKATIFEGRKGTALGETGESTRVNGTPTVCRVRLVVEPEINADVNGDGVVDIDDVNAVVNAVLNK